MPTITKALIEELITELTALHTALPDEATISSTLSFRRLITTINNLNWAINPNYTRYPSFHKK